MEQVIPCAQRAGRAVGKSSPSSVTTTASSLDVEPARYFVRVRKREKGACARCATITMQEREARIVEKGLASDAVVIHNVVAKYCDHRVPTNAAAAMPSRSCGRDEGRPKDGGAHGRLVCSG